MTPLFIIDTNVVVAALISGSSDSPTCRVLHAMLSGAFPFVLSPTLLAEYRNVLLRPAIGKLHGLSADQVDVILTDLAANALIRDPSQSPAADAPDPGDQHLWQLLAAMPNATLVTGDRELIEHPPRPASVLGVRAAVESLAL